ncbi:unnamed protein product [Dovyalis caffra]|uniref:Uncharacterized protein n=1 Tax=Dovyalis caffra TaxID=77055 RepID=A0AAV1SV89_9ROSI|nr:unnamed protein product [Dovyalis caffra]
MPVLKVLLITAVGVVLAIERLDIMGKHARMHLNNVNTNIVIVDINASPEDHTPCNQNQRTSLKDHLDLVFYVLNPALVGSNLAKFVTLKRIVQLTDSDEATQDAVLEGIEPAPETPENLPSTRTGSLLPLKEPSHNEGMKNFELDRAVLSEGKPKVPFPENIKQVFQEVLKKLNLKRVFSPSINGAIVGFIIGTIPPFRKVLIGDNAPLHVIEDSAFLLGESAVTIATLIVGANLLKGFNGSKLPILVIIGISAVRPFWLAGRRPTVQVCSAASICTASSNQHRYNDPVVWSWRNRMFGDHAVDLFLGHSCGNALVCILHVVRQITLTSTYTFWEMHYCIM